MRGGWNRGLTKETDKRVANNAKKISKFLIGHIVTEETRLKLKKSKQNISWGKHTEESKKKISRGNKGKKRSEEHKNKISLANKGKNNGMFNKRGILSPTWIDGRTSLKRMIRKLPEYSNWRKEIYKRDNYTCQECFKIGNKLEVHHIKSFKKIIDDFLLTYSQFSSIDDKETLLRLTISYEPFWNIDNWQTLCNEFHDIKKLHVWNNNSISRLVSIKRERNLQNSKCYVYGR